MSKRLVILFSVIAILFPAGTVRAASQAAPARADAAWYGEYFNNPTLTGPPAFVRSDAALNFDWGLAAPSSTLNNDNFSARWTRSVDFSPATYRFTLTSDDGARVYLDGMPIIDQWANQSLKTTSVDRALTAGAHQLRVEYFEGTGRAQLKFSWQPVSNDSNAWQAQYFNNTSLSGTPVLIRSETAINYTWGTGSPQPGLVNSDLFSARWARVVDLQPGTYRFSLTVDDGARLWVNDRLVMDVWRVQGQQSYTADVSVPGGATSLKLDYFEEAGNATAILSWAPMESTTTAWRGEYFNNPVLSGTPVLVREDPAINFYWATGSPASGIPADNFSVRWTRTANVPAGTYQAALTVDDGARLWVNDQLLIDAWQDQAAQTRTASFYVSGGSTKFRMEYYENGGYASAKLAVTAQNDTIQNWRGEYFNNANLSGAPASVRDDAQINFNWGTGSPASGINPDYFSVRWTRSVNFNAGWYRFKMVVDDGARLYTNGKLLIDAWKVQGAQPAEKDVYLNGGSVSILFEYFENTGAATAVFVWELLPGPPQPPATTGVTSMTWTAVSCGRVRRTCGSRPRKATTGICLGRAATSRTRRTRPRPGGTPRWRPANMRCMCTSRTATRRHPMRSTWCPTPGASPSSR